MNRSILDVVDSVVKSIAKRDVLGENSATTKSTTGQRVGRVSLSSHSKPVMSDGKCQLSSSSNKRKRVNGDHETDEVVQKKRSVESVLDLSVKRGGAAAAAAPESVDSKTNEQTKVVRKSKLRDVKKLARLEQSSDVDELPKSKKSKTKRDASLSKDAADGDVSSVPAPGQLRTVSEHRRFDSSPRESSTKKTMVRKNSKESSTPAVASVQTSTTTGNSEKTMDVIPAKIRNRKIVFQKNRKDVIPDVDLIELFTSKYSRKQLTHRMILGVMMIAPRRLAVGEIVELTTNVHVKPYMIQDAAIHVYGKPGLALMYGRSVLNVEDGGMTVIAQNLSNKEIELSDTEAIGFVEIRALYDNVKFSLAFSNSEGHPIKKSNNDNNNNDKNEETK